MSDEQTLFKTLFGVGELLAGIERDVLGKTKVSLELDGRDLLMRIETKLGSMHYGKAIPLNVSHLTRHLPYDEILKIIVNDINATIKKEITKK